MFGPHAHSGDYEQSRQHVVEYDRLERIRDSAIPGTGPESLSRLATGANIAASYNAPVRAAAVQGMQQTHGNRAVQRALSPGGRTTMQRDAAVQEDQQVNGSSFMYQPQPFAPVPSLMYNGPALAPAGNSTDVPQDANGEVCEMDEGAPDFGNPGTSVPNTDFNQYELDKDSISKVRKGRTALSKTLSLTRQGAKTAAGAAEAERSLSSASMLKNLSTAPTEDIWSGFGAYESAAENAASKSKLASTLEQGAGTTSTLGRGMRGANYGLQFLQNMAEGQDVGESAFGAAAGGYTSNSMGGYMMKASPKLGVADAAINLVNAGLNLIPGMPKEVTQTTQVIADATPSSFATSLASNAGRGLWNTGKGIFTGDWDSLKQQGSDITHGKAGAPLQGYGLVRELFNSRERYGEITDEMRNGEYGFLPKMSLKAKEWASDKWDSWMGRGTKAQRENSEKRADYLEYEHAVEARKDREKKAAFEKEMADMRAQIEHPTVGGTMLGGPGDAHSGQAIMEQFVPTQYDEDGVPLPRVSMALPEPTTKRKH